LGEEPDLTGFYNLCQRVGFLSEGLVSREQKPGLSGRVKSKNAGAEHLLFAGIIYFGVEPFLLLLYFCKKKQADHSRSKVSLFN